MSITTFIADTPEIGTFYFVTPQNIQKKNISTDLGMLCCQLLPEFRCFVISYFCMLLFVEKPSLSFSGFDGSLRTQRPARLFSKTCSAAFFDVRGSSVFITFIVCRLFGLNMSI